MDLTRTRAVIITGLVVFLSTGCDAFVSKPKTTSKSSARSTPTEAKKVDVSSIKSESAAKTPAEPLPAHVVAKVGDWTLTLEEFEDRLKGVKQVVPDFDAAEPGAKEAVLDELLRQQLLVYEGRRQKVDQSQDIRNAVKDFENTLIVREFAEGLVKGVQATEQDAREYYDANPDVFIVPVEKRVREIVLLTEAEAKSVLVELLQGADFAQIAKNRSKGKSAVLEGDLGYLTETPFELMKKEIDSLKKGDISRVFSGPEGYYLVKVEDVRGGDKQPYAEIEKDLVKWLTGQKQQQAVMEVIAKTAETVKVQVNAELLKGDK